MHVKVRSGLLEGTLIKSGHKYINIAFISGCVALLFILLIRVTKGLDLSDEMQYYGQIKGLIKSGVLFSNDLFIQQDVYILFYPLFYMYHWLFNYDGFVFFGRLLMAMLVVTIYLYSYRKVIEFNCAPIVAAFTAISLTFAVDHHNLFAISYNTVSQCLWIIFMLRFLQWKWDGPFIWSFILILEVFAHPISAVVMTLLLFGRLTVCHDYNKLVQICFVLFGNSLIVILLLLYFSPFQGYLSAILFSSGYGVGSVFFSSMLNIMLLSFMWLGTLVCYLLRDYFNNLYIYIFIFMGLLLAIFLFSFGYAGSVSYRTVIVMAPLHLLLYGLALSKHVSNMDLWSKVNWLAVAFLVYGSSLAVTSGSGISQMTGTLMVSLPLLLSIVAIREPNSLNDSVFDSVILFSVLILPLLFIVNMVKNPFNEEPVYDLKEFIHSVPEFRFISSTHSKIVFIDKLQKELKLKVEGKHVLIVSDLPGLYFILNAKPETCMFFMHSVTSDKSKSQLLNCLNGKKPELIIDIMRKYHTYAGISRVKQVMRDYAMKNDFICSKKKELVFDVKSQGVPLQLEYALCTHAANVGKNLKNNIYD